MCKALHARGFRPVAFDSLVHGHEWAVRWGPFVQGDIHDFLSLSAVIERYAPVAAIHLAGSIHAREASLLPHSYYYNNVEGSRIFFQALVENGVGNVVSASSAAVYADSDLPRVESSPIGPKNAYGKSKWAMEMMLEDFAQSFGLDYVALRCFNVAGADREGEIGEAHPKETHLIPLALESAAQDGAEPLNIFGDGSCLRDYVHVEDVAEAFVLSVEHLLANKRSLTLNIGSGKGYSTLEVVQHIEELLGKKVPCQFHPKQPHESSHLVACIEEACSKLSWKPHLSDLDHILTTASTWHRAYKELFAAT